MSMNTSAEANPTIDSAHASVMDGMYRWQRHFYDVTRKHYLLGRDLLLDGLDADHKTILEIGCGTGRNLVGAAKRYPSAQIYGIDISAEMLISARKAIAQNNLEKRVHIALGDATDFDPQVLFGIARFDRVFFSYTLSMIPHWREALAEASSKISPPGSLHVVDFGTGERLPAVARQGLDAWLKAFHVTRRADLAAEIARLGTIKTLSHPYRSYAFHATVTGLT